MASRWIEARDESIAFLFRARAVCRYHSVFNVCSGEIVPGDSDKKGEEKQLLETTSYLEQAGKRAGEDTGSEGRQ